MHCPFCQHKETKVIDSRESQETNAIRRRRECLACEKRFTTFETVELSVQVNKRDGRYEDFQQQKLLNGLAVACRHTTVSHDQVIALAAQIASDLMQRQVREVSTTELGDLAMERLLQLDPIAYIRFACVYRRIKEVDELFEVIKTIRPKDDAKPKNRKTVLASP